jgi:hypothetical protein
MAVVDPRVERWRAPRDDRASAEEDVARYRGLPAEATLAECFALSRAARRLMAAALPPDRYAAALAYEEPMGEREAAIWRQWVRSSRAGNHS